jgi:plastocyanin
MRIIFGPIHVKPGQNDVLIQPVTNEKPLYDGYMVRFRPGLFDAKGATPPVEALHLHHGTWLNTAFAGNPLSRSYGAGPWLATGEEKTIAIWPKGYGLLIKPTDDWLFLHMVHNATAAPNVVWVTYDIDYVDATKVASDAITNTKGIWLDVGGSKFHSGTQTYPYNPVYNVMRGYGHEDAELGGRACTFPLENCAAYNSLGNASAQQGVDVSGQTSTSGLPLRGMDYRIPYGFLGGTEANPGVGTLVLMGGHLHTGGIRDEVSLVRKFADGHVEERTIHVSDAYYWDHANPTRAGGAPTSWDFSMTGVTRDIGWSVNVREGDILRLNALYDSDLGAWWENMGIVMTWVVPGAQVGKDMFAKDANGDYLVQTDRRVPVTAVIPPGNVNGAGLPGGYGCAPSDTMLCVRGQVTHGHYATSGNHGSCATFTCAGFEEAALPGPLVTDIRWANFTFGESDATMVKLLGVPRVRKGDTLTFWNADAAGYIPHTATACAFPCTGPVTVDHPISNGSYAIRTPAGYQIAGQIDFDSTELAYGIGPAGKLSWALNTSSMNEGIYTYFCRIHPAMRGAFEVVPASTTS